MADLLDHLLAAQGKTRGDLQTSRRGWLAESMRREGVEDSPDVARVLALDPRPEPSPEVVEALSAMLRLRPVDPATGRPNRLRVPQASALIELADAGGLFAPMRVGSGKTLVTLLAPTLLASERPVLILPAAMFRRSKKTQREFAMYRENWRVRLPRLISYEELGRPDREHQLVKAAPDLLILDEAHFARNLDAAVTRRIRRCIEWLRPRVAALSGTLMTDSLMDYWHLARWTLGDLAPVPSQRTDAERWARALDSRVGTLKRIDLGALERFKPTGGFHDHFRSRRGVVPTPGSDCDAGIEIRMWTPKISQELRDTIGATERSGMRPDGELLDEFELPNCLCQLALGFYYRWDPMPPSWWLDPRRAWRAYVRGVLDEQIPGYDSESQLTRALDGHEPERPSGHEEWFEPLTRTAATEILRPRQPPPAANEGRQLLAEWRAVRDKFEPNPVPVWIDRGVMIQARDYAADGCLIWTRYQAAGHELDRIGVPYFGGGTNPEAPRPERTIALSIAAHHIGKNLQSRSKALVLTPMANPDQWEQLIGREHRAGQTADTVQISVISSIDYHGAVLSRVLSRARATSRSTGFSQKLVDATWI